MSVSVTEHTNVDLDALVAGGDAFMARVKALQQAKVDHAAALDALNIGRDAVAAMQNAQQREQTALNLIEQAKKDAQDLIAAASADAEKIRNLAQTEIAALHSAAQSKSEAIEQEVKVARAAVNAWTERTRKETSDHLARATETRAAAEKQHADNKKTAADLLGAQAEAQALTQSATEKHAALDAKLEAIKAAAS